MGKLPHLRFMIMAGVVLFAVWLLLRSYTSPAARECRDMYHAARTAADSASIDTVFVEIRGQDHPSSCGFMRMTARWQ